MKRMWMLALTLPLVLCGCAPTAREPDQLALVRVLGVEGNSPVELTAVCGMDKTDQTPIRGRCGGDTFAVALEGVPWSAFQELSLTSVSYLMVDTQVDLAQVLEQVLEDEELGATATVWLAQGDLSRMLEGCDDPEGDLTLLTHQGVQAPTVVEVLAALTTRGRAELPQVEQRGGQLVQAGRWTWEE